MKKRILIGVLFAVMLAAIVLAASAANTGAVDPNEVHSQISSIDPQTTVCPYCGVLPEGGWTALDTDITQWQRINGHYYVSSSRNNTSYYAVLAGDKACVALEGLGIYAEDSYAFQVEGGTLTIMGSASISGGFADGSTVGATIDVVSGTLNLCGGEYYKSGSSANAIVAVRGAGSVVNMYNGTSIADGNANDYEGGNVRISAEATFNMYGGEITGGKGYCGGNVALLADGAQFNMYGGSVVDGKAQLSNGDLSNAEEGQYAKGGNIYVEKGNITVSKDAAVTGGSAYAGGNIYYASGNTCTVAGVVSGGTAKTGGNLDVRSGSKVVLSAGGMVSGGYADYDGGNLQLYHATLELDGGNISAGTAARWGGNVFADGSSGQVVIRSGNISGGETTGAHGGNICVEGGALLQMSGGTVAGGIANHATEGRGGNMYFGNAAVQISGGSVTMGKAYVAGGNIHVQATEQTVVIDGCEIDHGQAAAGGNLCAVNASVEIGGDTVVTEGVSNWPKGSSFAGGGGNIFCQGGQMLVYGQIRDGKANLTGGNIEVRAATLQLLEGAQVTGGQADYDGGNILVNNTGTLVISNSTVQEGTAGRDGVNIYAGGWISLEGTACANDDGGIYLADTAQLRVYADFDGNVALSGLVLPAQPYGETLDSERFECTGSYSGTLWLPQYGDKPCVFGNGQTLQVGAVYTVKDGNKIWYPDNTAAVAGYGDADYLVPKGDVVLAGGNYTVDLAGQELNITGSGRVTCFDSSNDTYKTYGHATINGPIFMNNLAQTVGDKHYVRIKTDGTYSFHRFALKVTDVSLRFGSCGIYYSALWECDDAVVPLIQGFGIGVSLADMPTERLRYDDDTLHTYHGPEEFVSGIKTNGVLVQNILLDHESAEPSRVEKNNVYGQMPIYAKAYVILDNGVEREQTLISNDNIGISLHDAIATIDENMPLYYSIAQYMKDFRDYWVQNGLSAEDWNFEFSVPVQILQLQESYQGQQLLTGQLHDRLENDADLTGWISRMGAEQIDFAVCLENGKVQYMESDSWDSTAFVGGLEARFAVDGKTLDANLLFATKADMEAVLTGSGGFDYVDGVYTTKAMTNERFISFVEYVQSHKGLFLLAHPKDISLINSRDALDYWFTDGVAIDIGTSEQNYKLWTDLLAEGKRVWAIRANAGNLTGRAEAMALYAEGKNAQAILSRLSAGDVTCGSVGLQMMVGNTLMGGVVSFEGETLAIGVQQAPAGLLETGHTYRVDLISKTGILRSWPYTGRAMYELVEADANQAFYRLEVVDESTGQRIAVGNPIWNEGYGLRAGFAREDITPDYTVLIVGGKQRASEGVKEGDGIYLTCVALQEGDQTYLVFTADLINADSSRYTANMKKAVSQATGVPASNIIFSTTHAHSSVGINLDHWTFTEENDGDENLARFRAEFNAAAVRAAQNAIADLTSVDAAYTGTVTGKQDVAFVRHYVKRNGTLDYSNEGSYDSADSWLASLRCQYKEHAAAADNEIQLVKFQRADNKKDVVLMSVPSHGTLNENSKLLSADFPLYARQYVESNTNSLVAYFIGAAGDQVPKSKLCDYHLSNTLNVSNNTDAATYGQKLGQYAVAVLEGDMTRLRSTALQMTTAVFEGAVATDHFDAYETALDLVQRYQAGEDVATALKNAGFAGVDDARYTVYRYEYAKNNGTAMNMSIRTVAVGDLGFVFAPYEMSGVNGMQIKEGSPYGLTFIATCTDDSVSYVASQIAFDHESYEAQCTWFEPGSGELLAKRYIEVLQQQKYYEK